MHNSQEVATTIKNFAKSKKIAIGTMLTDCCLSKNTLSSMQSGGYLPRTETLGKIADYLDCSVDYLLGRTNNPEINRDTTTTSPIENDGLLTNEKMTEIFRKIPSTPKELEKQFTPVEPPYKMPHKNTTG